MTISFTVYGTPRPQGSMRQFYIKTPYGREARMTSDNRKLKPWRQEIAETALTVAGNRELRLSNEAALYARLVFYFERPKSVKPKKRPDMTVKPDVDKLTRAVFDALKGILYRDDALIVSVMAEKQYGTPERVEIALDTIPLCI